MAKAKRSKKKQSLEDEENISPTPEMDKDLEDSILDKEFGAEQSVTDFKPDAISSASFVKSISELQNIAATLPLARNKVVRDVEIAAAHIIDVAKEIVPAIGEISVDEAKDAIVREFANKLLSQ